MEARRVRHVVAVVTAVFVVISIIVTATATTATHDDPDPTIVEVDIPDEVIVGETFTVEVRAKNTGSDAGPWSTVSISAPAMDGSSDDSQVAVIDQSDHEYKGVFTAGDSITVKGGGQTTAEYLLAEVGTGGDDEWPAGEARDVGVMFAPTETGTFPVYVRVTLTDDDDTTQKFNAPSYSSYTDQQDFRVLRREVTVREEPNIDATIVDLDQDSGSYKPGDTVRATATVENTGNREHTYFVGYSVRGPNRNWYDNDGSTGTTVTLQPGERRAVDLEWTVEDGAPVGSYDVKSTVWEEQDRDNLYTGLDTVEQYNRFDVEAITFNAQLVELSQSSGTYRPGDVVTATATVKNSGNTAHTYFVGYSVRGPDGQWRDNNDRTGTTVRLRGGEQKDIRLSWTVPNDAPAGDYDVTSAIWEESDRDNLVTKHDDRTLTNAFKVEANPVDVKFDVSDGTTVDDFQNSGDPIEGARVAIGGNTYHTASDGGVNMQLAPGEYDFSVTADGYQRQSGTVTVPKGTDTLKIVFVHLAPIDDGTLRISVVNQAGDQIDDDFYRVTIDDEEVALNSQGDVTLSPGTHDVVIAPTTSADFNPTSRTVTVESGERTTAEFIVAIDGDESEVSLIDGVRPTDPDGDGYYEDLNGNGRLDFDDVVTFSTHRTDANVTRHRSAYDLNGDGAIDARDVELLFEEV